MDRRDFLRVASGALTSALLPPAGLSFVAISLRNCNDGSPMAGEAFRLTGPDGRIYEGTLDANGEGRIDGVPEGDYKVEFPRWTNGEYWAAGRS